MNIISILQIQKLTILFWWSCICHFFSLHLNLSSIRFWLWNRWFPTFPPLILIEYWGNFCPVHQRRFRGGEKFASNGQSALGSDSGWRILWAACQVDLLTSSWGQQTCQGAELQRVGLESSLLWHIVIQISGYLGHVTTCSSTFYPPILRHTQPMTGSTVEVCEFGRPFSGIKGQPFCGCCGDWCVL